MKRILLLALCGMTFQNIFAQEATVTTEAHYTVSGGLLGALNLTKFKMKGDNATKPEYDSKAGWSAGAWVNFPLGSKFSIEPQLMYSSYNYYTNSATPQLLNEGNLNYISIPLLLKFSPINALAITAGPQVDFLTSVDDDRNIATNADFNKTSLSVFGGLELFPHARVSLFGRYIHGLSNMDERTVHTPGLEYRNQNIQVGLKFRLFGKKTEPYKATTTTTVTPPPVVIPDSDGDGINDNLDKCPNVAGVAKYEGCPVPDSDGDGINDENDKCPNQAGLAKYDGCPAPDKDGDGINDDADRCPDIAGLASNNGCPEVPANVSKSLGMSAQNISFGTTSSTNATLTTRSYTSLDQVVRIMNENPGLNIRVEGHTSNAGNADANMTLSENRANAVKTYLVSKGISADRITVEGFGGTQPIADNNTASGRMKNTRVDIRVAY
jgi:outer membrane protein OmpA-like peptidoglycan-associated protein